MSKKIVRVLIVVLALALSACTRAASSAPTGTATPKANFPKPVATSGMNAIEIAGTQTAVATGGLPMPTSGTPLSGVHPTATPAAENLTPVVTPPAELTSLPSPTSALAANTPLPAPTTGPISRPATYALHEGEFPYCLARRFNINPDELLALNGLSSSQGYYAPGANLIIPQAGSAFPGQRALMAHPAQHIVIAGETIYSVACKFGDVDPVSIVTVNNLSGNFNLTAGTTIQIP